MTIIKKDVSQKSLSFLLKFTYISLIQRRYKYYLYSLSKRVGITPIKYILFCVLNDHEQKCNPKYLREANHEITYEASIYIW